MKKVAMIIPMTSRNRNFESIKNTPFFRIIYQSLKRTIEEGYQYKVFLGVDDDDDFFIFNKEEIENLKFDNVDIEMYVINNHQHSPVGVWNELFKIAYNEEYEYFYQIGDDILLVDKDWTSKFISNLESNLATGPLDVNMDKLMTQSFVDRRHYETFGFYFPTEFKNWFCDNWMHTVYQVTNNLNWDHDIRVRNSGGAERYDIDMFDQNEFRKIVERDIEKLQKK